jgi:hypothetical protein
MTENCVKNGEKNRDNIRKNGVLRSYNIGLPLLFETSVDTLSVDTVERIPRLSNYF